MRLIMPKLVNWLKAHPVLIGPALVLVAIAALFYLTVDPITSGGFWNEMHAPSEPVPLCEIHPSRTPRTSARCTASASERTGPHDARA
jgi:hypothetical protein